MPPIYAQLADGRYLEFPEGTDPSVVERAVKAQIGTSPTIASTAPPAPAAPSQRPSQRIQSVDDLQRYERERTDAGVAAVPGVLGAIGGIAGAAMGPVGAIGGAALGGAVGKAVQQTYDRGHEDRAANVPSTARGQLAEMGTSAATQGAYELGGQALAKGASAAGRYLMNRALTRVSAKLSREFPDLAQDMIDRALTVSAGGERKARALLARAKGQANVALAKATQAGGSIPVQLTPDVAQTFKSALLEQAINSGATKAAATPGAALTVASQRLPREVEALMSQIDEAVKAGETVEMTPIQADLLKRQLQKEVKALYANRVAPNGPNAMGHEATIKAELSSRINDAIERLASGYKAANAEAKTLIGASRAVQQARRPSGALYQALVRPLAGAAAGGAIGGYQGGTTGATSGAIAGATLASPQGMSRAAVTLGHPIVQAALKQLPRSLAVALEQLLSGQDQEP